MAVMFPRRMAFRSNILDDDHGNAHGRKAEAQGAVHDLRGRFIGEFGCQHGEDQGENDAHGEDGIIRDAAADGKVGDGACQGGKGHDKHAGPHGGLQLIAQHADQDQEHHHAAACADKAADQAHRRAADDRLHGGLFSATGLVALPGRHDRLENELQPREQGHEHGEAAHGGLGEQGGDIAAHQRKDQHGDEHDEAVFHVQIAVLFVGVGRDCRGQHIRGQGNADGLIGVHVQKCDEHRRDHRRGGKSRQTGAEAGSRAGDETYDEFYEHTVFLFLPFLLPTGAFSSER